jgi:hypothetical protein
MMSVTQFVDSSPASAPATGLTVSDDHGIDEAIKNLQRDGYSLLANVFSPAELDELDAECDRLQRQLIDGSLPDKCGTVRLIDRDRIDATPFVHYVSYASECSDAVLRASGHAAIQRVMHSVLGKRCWLLEQERFGVVYQEARTGSESAYSRIGWHSDWQSGPDLNCWPSIAFTIHLDATSPDNGFLRVVPGSHRWATPAPTHDIDGVAAPFPNGYVGGWTQQPPPSDMPSAFEKVRGEQAVYAERGDVIFHDAYTWHAAARGSRDNAVRRHLRGGYYAGDRFPQGFGIGSFVKNAAR